MSADCATHLRVMFVWLDERCSCVDERSRRTLLIVYLGGAIKRKEIKKFTQNHQQVVKILPNCEAGGVEFRFISLSSDSAR